MKNVNLLQLIASLCMLFGSVINLLALITEIPPWLSVCALPLLLAVRLILSRLNAMQYQPESL